jgi:hypothetical protein
MVLATKLEVSTGYFGSFAAFFHHLRPVDYPQNRVLNAKSCFSSETPDP